MTDTVFNELYIDEIYIDTNNGSPFTGITNTYLNQSSDTMASGVSKTEGYKWIIQLTNGSGSTINLNDYRIDICTNYLNNTYSNNDIDKAIAFNSATLASGASTYIGFSGLATALGLTLASITSASSSNILYLSDQSSGVSPNVKIEVATRFRLFKNGTGYIQNVGTGANNPSTEGTSSHTYNNSVVLSATHRDIYEKDTGSSNTSGDGSWRIKPTNTPGFNAPKTTYVPTEWRPSDSINTNNLTGSAVGDPHILTIYGKHYDFNHIGYLRYFDNCDENDRLIINIKSDKGDYKRWNNNEYIREVFISYNNKKILINTGFRDKKVKVINNIGFIYEENKLEFYPFAKRYAVNSFFSSSNDDEINEFIRQNPDNMVPELVRNIVKVKINKTFTITIENVNKYNLQPCRIKLLINNKCYECNKWKGLVIDAKWAYPSIIKNIDDISDLRNINLDDKIPEFTIPSYILNEKWE